MVVVSAGFHKTHVTTAAREVLDRGCLVLLITGAYPTPSVKALASRLKIAHSGRLARLLERDEGIPEERMRVIALPELLAEAARVFALLRLAELYARLCSITWRLYGWLAARTLTRVGATGGVYHFRAGFGGGSITRARELGMHVLCDHAIAHPELLGGLVRNRGRWTPEATNAFVADAELPSTEKVILADINASDSVVVNSDFVKETFLAAGWAPDRVHVVYLGVDENFLSAVTTARLLPSNDRLRLLFAGRFERRKGADTLVEALSSLDDFEWELVIAGPVTPEIRAEHAAFLEDTRVTVLGTISREHLAAAMLASPVFVFPSYAEGSARAVFEALACGCYVITTPNSGTIVRDGIHGALVPAGDSKRLRSAIMAAHDEPARVARIGSSNASLISEHYRQRDYGDALAALYPRLHS